MTQRVRVFDPVVVASLARDPKPGVDYCADEYDAARGAEALVLATEWNQFRSLDLDRLRELLARPVVVDLRNIYEPDTMHRLGFDYTGVGR